MAGVYEQDGVDVASGDEFSTVASQLIRSTYDNSPYIEVVDLSQGLFRGPRPFRVVNLPSGYMFDAGPDGVGTKVVLNDALLWHAFSAFDLLAMTCSDITRFGGLPSVFYNVLDVRQIGKPGSQSYYLFVQALNNLVIGANEMNLVVHKGETAETGECVGSFNPNPIAPYNWAGCALGLFYEDKVIYGDRVQPGDIVVALRENGFRSNGISTVRRAFEMKFGDRYYEVDEAKDLLALAAGPSELYDHFLANMHGWYSEGLEPQVDMKLIAHITGGGMGKFLELLAITGHSAVLGDLYPLPYIMNECAYWRGMSSEEVYSTWNGGQGMVIVLPASDAELFISSAKNYKIDAQVCGEIVSSRDGVSRLEIFSRYQNRWIAFT